MIPLTAAQIEIRDRVAARLADGTYAQEEVPCLCGRDGGEVIAERDRYGLPVRTVLCPDCGLLRTSPRMTPEATSRFYEEDYRGLYTGHENRERLFQGQVRGGMFLLQQLGRLLTEGAKVYEVGCGAGGVLLPFARAGCHVSGVDLGSEYLEIGRREGLDLLHGDARTLLAERGGDADLVIVRHVLEHFLDLPGEVAALADLLAPGGVLWVEVPGVLAIGEQYGGDFLRFLQNAHTYHFTARTLAYALARCDLEVRVTTEHAFGLALKSGDGTTPVLPEGEADRVRAYLEVLERGQAQAA